jgi:hypothetical protein
MAKTEKIKLKNEPLVTKKATKKSAKKTEKTIEKKETPPEVIVLKALNNNFPSWTNGLALETDLLEAIHPVHLRDVLDKLVAEKLVAFDLGNFSYQITEYGKFYYDSILDSVKN